MVVPKWRGYSCQQTLRRLSPLLIGRLPCMSSVTCPRVLIAGASSGVGKSFISLGVLVALAQRGLSVAVCLHGVRLPQAALYRRITNRQPCILDPQLLTEEQIVQAVRWAGVGADIVVIDGNLGLYDGRNPGSWKGSDARLAEMLGAPVVFVFDGGIFDSSAGALVKGFVDSAQNRLSVAGAIANWLDLSTFPARNRQLFEKTLTSFGAPKLLGAIPIFPPAASSANAIPGIIAAQDKNRTLLSHSFIAEVGKWVSGNLDVDALISIANHANPLEIADEAEFLPTNRRCRIAVSDDSCFHIGFPDNLNLLRLCGAELVSFSPLADSELPDRIGAVYLTGAYLSEYGAELAANSDMRESLRAFVARGGVVYAEAGGAAFLCEHFDGGGGEGLQRGIGVLKGRAKFVSGEADYIALKSLVSSLLGDTETIVRGVDTSEWFFEEWSEAPIPVMKEVLTGRHRSAEMLSVGAHVFVTTAFLHWGSAQNIAQRFVDAAEQSMQKG